MIRHIRIRDFAIIEDIDIDFHDGLNIVTGETGAGKSILIEAVSLALGSRADTAFVRSGKKKAIIQMVADFQAAGGADSLNAAGTSAHSDPADGADYPNPAGGEVILTREISAEGRNLCKINGSIVTLAELSALSHKLADIHGQYDHQSLLDPASHIQLLDRYGNDTISPARSAVASAFEEYSQLQRQLQALEKQLSEDLRQQDFIAFEYRELQEAGLTPGEDDALEEDVARLQHSEQIYEDLAAAYSLSEEGDYALLPGFKRVSDYLDSAGQWSGELDTLKDRVQSLYYEFEDICEEIRKSRDASVYSPEELDRAIGRLDLLNRLKQKHGKSIDELIAYRDELSLRLEHTSDAGAAKQRLESELEESVSRLSAACEKLHDLRVDIAADLEKKISQQLQQLNFNDSRFQVSFQQSDVFTSGGNDIVEFLISTNRGEDLKPLAKIASGGEMSRIMLAFKKIIGDYDEIPSMIFDEIDSGISGIAASVVGQKLREISTRHQIICITHLPQIAACGDHHYRISKDSDETMTYTRVDELSEEDRITEIARLLGGSTVTETTLQSAEELILASRSDTQST